MRRELVPVIVCGIMTTAGLGSCTGGTSPAPAPSSPRTANEAPASGFVRTCDSSQPGSLARDWRKDSLFVGSLIFVGLKSAAKLPPSTFESKKGGLPVFQTIVIVKGTVDETVSVLSPVGKASLLYDPSKFQDVNAYRVSDGDLAVRFQACGQTVDSAGNQAPQYIGGFIVNGPICLTLAVTDPAPSRDHEVIVPFGQSCA